VLKTETGMYHLDATYVPSLLDVHASDTVSGIIRGIVELLVTRSSQLSGGRRQKNQTLADFTASDVANFWLLYTINTHLPGLRHYLESTGVQPQMLFGDLSDLAGALTAFSTKIDPRDLPRYDHENLGPCFIELDRLIRAMLETVVPTNVVSIPLNLLRDTIYACSIDKDSWFDNSRFYLAVSADMREADLIDRIPKLTKVCSATHIETLIRQALPGIKLTHVEQPPRALPVKLKYKYFSIERSGTAWEAVQRARNFAVYAPSDLLNPQMELIILLPKAD
jgi:type VI secretion system protein ImpJ